MRITNTEKKELNSIILKVGIESSNVGFSSNKDDNWRININPGNFFYSIVRTSNDYVIIQVNPDKISNPALTLATFTNVKLNFENWANEIWDEILTDPDYLPMRSAKFGPLINEISPRFETIYNQTEKAEYLKLYEICGTGYRKSLEFLIKDYLMYKLDETEYDFIKKSPIIRCLEKFEKDLGKEIKTTSERGFWLGNDHSHYIVKWKKHNLQNLKELIKDTSDWIIRHEKVIALEKNMPNPKSKS